MLQPKGKRMEKKIRGNKKRNSTFLNNKHTHTRHIQLSSL
jgi:hypothetical protein